MDAGLFKKVVDDFGDIGYLMMFVRSHSMEPLLEEGDGILVKITTDVRKGDIVVFEGGGNIIVHRVRLRVGPFLVTRGDNQKNFDYPRSVGKIIGKVVAIVKGS